jgi:regulator of protease activity HflC (stomatin/prohibitin superfamily)
MLFFVEEGGRGEVLKVGKIVRKKSEATRVFGHVSGV